MKRLTEEQIQQAKRIDLLTWLRTHQPDELVQVGRTEYTTRTHDSLRISENGKWNWFSRGFGGTTALNYLIRVQGMDFVSAVRLLCEVEPVPAPPSHPSMPAPPREFHPPVKDRGTEAVTAYLKGRGIRGQVIRWCLREGILYQTTRAGYKNCVFVGLDETGRPRAASLRGCTTRMQPRSATPASASMSGIRVDLPLPVGALSSTQNPGAAAAASTSLRMASMGRGADISIPPACPTPRRSITFSMWPAL